MESFSKRIPTGRQASLTSMARRFPAGVVEVWVYRSQLGFRYNGRNKEGRIIYEKPPNAAGALRSRFDVQKEVRRRWPGVRIVYS